MKYIFCFIILVLVSNLNFAQNRITKEADVPNFVLPDLLISADGQKIKNKTDWEKIRRTEILQLFENQVYGKVPEGKINIQIDEKILNLKALNGKATLKEVNFIFERNTKTIQATLLLFLPNSIKKAAPLFLAYNFDGNHTVFPDELISIPKGWARQNIAFGMQSNQATALSRGVKASRWPIINLINRGYGLATMFYGDIDPDFDDNFQNGIHSLFGNATPLQANDWGAISTWAWALSRIMDYLETSPIIDAQKVALVGHSRLGKTALWAGAKDERFALIISNNSGCGGAALSKRKFGETIKVINTSFPHWFCDNFNQYNDQEEKLPVDQHQLIALMAPRPVYIASASKDSWADPKGEFLAAKFASPIYELYGLKGLSNDTFPAENKPDNKGYIAYHLRSGKHDLTIYDWEQYLDFADLHFRKK